MSKGYCPNCKAFYDEGRICGLCGHTLVFSENTNQELKSDKLKSHTWLRSKDSFNTFNIIGLFLLFIYNVVGIIISLNILQKISRSQQGFLYKIEISNFWIWLFFIIHMILLIGAVILNSNKSLKCILAQGIIWLCLNVFTLVKIKTIDIENLNFENRTVSWENGAIVHFAANTEISRLVCTISYSIAHLFVIVFWILAVAFVIIGSYNIVKRQNN